MQQNNSKKISTRKITVTAMLSAVAAVLMLIEVSVPFMPEFIKLDISELPALLAAFGLGPVCGAAVCLIKNLIKALLMTTSGGVGELANFLLGVCFVVPAGLIYKHRKSRLSAAIGAVVGAAIMGIVCVPINYYITYPIYMNFMPVEAIVGMYQEIRPSTNGLLECLMVFNMPYTFGKGILDAIICFLIYKPLSPILHGKSREKAAE